MSDASRTARRYHWLSDSVKSFVDEPHEAVCCDARGETLNLVAHENDGVRRASARLAAEKPEVALDALRVRRSAFGVRRSRSTGSGSTGSGSTGSLPFLEMPARHALLPELDVASRYLEK